jgi:transcriptional regulator with XRE-family HTH domain
VDTTQTSLTQALRDAGLSQLELARRVGTSESHVSRWVNGIHTPNRFYKREIARALRRKPEELWP